MPALLPQGHLLVAFLLASFVLAVTPGPGVFYIVTRTLAQGRRAGVASVAGVALGNLGNAIGASLGLVRCSRCRRSRSRSSGMRARVT